MQKSIIQSKKLQNQVQFEQTYALVLKNIKISLRLFKQNSNFCQQQCPIPIQGVQLLNIYNQDGTYNLSLSNQKFGTAWDQKNRIKVVIWGSMNSYRRTWKNNTGVIKTRGFPYDDRPFCTISGQIRAYCFNNLCKNIESEQEAAQVMYKLLGMGHKAKGNQTDRIFIEIWVHPQSLFRPALHPSTKKVPFVLKIQDHQAQISNPDPNYYLQETWQRKQNGENIQWLKSDKDQSSSCLNFITDFKNDMLYRLIGCKNDGLRCEEYPYPFTGLGYTFNWNNYDDNNPEQWMKSKDRVGMSQFIIKAGTQYEVAAIYKTLDYITNPTPENIHQQLLLQNITK